MYMYYITYSLSTTKCKYIYKIYIYLIYYKLCTIIDSVLKYAVYCQKYDRYNI